MNTYEPGTVAVATVRGVEGVRVVRFATGWFTPDLVGDAEGNEPQWRTHVDSQLTDIRPLVVLDLDDFRWAAMVLRDPKIEAMGTRNAIADQIEEQTKPPRIPEPGLWGVVSSEGSAWIRQAKNGPRDWHHYIDGWRAWDDLIDPTLIREGVSES